MSQTTVTESPNVIRPDKFDEYLLWACDQRTSKTTVIRKVIQNEYTPVQPDNKAKKKRQQKVIEESKSVESLSDNDRDRNFISDLSDSILQILTIYDHNDRLIEIFFRDNKDIPRKVFIIISLIAKFHPSLISVKINTGLDGYGIYELKNLTNVSRITHVCLDGTYLKTANYHSLLESPCNLQQLSLRGCRIDDDMVHKLADNLCYPSDASKSLYILNLSTNMITDVGAKYLAFMLRSNRNLAYLNLCDNLLTDEGAGAILDTLKEFLISSEELTASRARLVNYINNRDSLVKRLIAEMKYFDDDKKSPGRKKPKVRPRGRSLEKDNMVALRKSVIDFYYEKALKVADSVVGEFEDPFTYNEIIKKNDTKCCKGNNTLAYLNFAYNSLSYNSLRKILDVITYQKLSNRSPRGLFNINLDGNYLPKSCIELIRINDILETGLMFRRGSASKKKLIKGIK